MPDSTYQRPRLPILVDARFAGGTLRVNTAPAPSDGSPIVELQLPGLTVPLFPHEASQLASALAAVAAIAKAQR